MITKRSLLVTCGDNQSKLAYDINNGLQQGTVDSPSKREWIKMNWKLQFILIYSSWRFRILYYFRIQINSNKLKYEMSYSSCWIRMYSCPYYIIFLFKWIRKIRSANSEMSNWIHFYPFQIIFVCWEPLTIETAKKKINNLRSQYLDHLYKIKQLKASGVSTDEIYKPIWWLYEDMKFLDSHIAQRKGESSMT